MAIPPVQMPIGIFLLSLFPVLAISLASPSLADTPTLVLATTEGAGTRARSIDGVAPEVDPGHYVELSRKAAKTCGTRVEFQFMPWPRVLKSVRSGAVSAGFASSFKKERAEYGAYPMKDGQPNEALAQRAYSYSLYARADDKDAIQDWSSQISGALVGVERASSIISEIERLGGTPYEQTDYDSQLNLLLNARLRFAVGITDNFDKYVRLSDDYRDKLVRLDPPVQKRVGYVMFGKKFYEDHRDLVNCFWEEAAKLAKTEWYLERKSYYEATYQ